MIAPLQFMIWDTTVVDVGTSLLEQEVLFNKRFFDADAHVDRWGLMLKLG